MKKFVPENWQKLLIELHQWLGSDIAIWSELEKLVDLTSTQQQLLINLRLQKADQHDVEDAVGRALRYLHLVESQKTHVTAADKRRFIRHPTSVPIKIYHLGSLDNNGTATPTAFLPDKDRQQSLHDISLGGLSFRYNIPLQPATHIKVRIELVKPPFEAESEVVWCQERVGYYEIGARFLHPSDLEEARMVEQICHIEDYRRVLSKQGRQVEIEEAAVEWLTKYGKDFPEHVE